jgi:hypothetical protein
MADEFEKLVPEFLSMARRIFDAGRVSERERIISAALEGDTSRNREQPRQPRSRSAGYGAVSTPVREALRAVAVDHPEGIDTAEIVSYFDRIGGGPTERQIRAALKQLANTGEAKRASRGRYLPSESASSSPHSGEENPDAGTSGIFSLAAE